MESSQSLYKQSVTMLCVASFCNAEYRYTQCRGASVCPIESLKKPSLLELGVVFLYMNCMPNLVTSYDAFKVYQDGSVLLSHGGTEMGQGLHTKMIQASMLKNPFISCRCYGKISEFFRTL